VRYTLYHWLAPQAVFQGSFAVRPLSGAAAGAASAQEQGGQKQQQPRDSKGALAAQQEEFDAITDQIPQRPVGIVEGTSYTLLIAAGIALAGAL
jgi:import inner membrane translocase subunit TIM21